jgi:hypothetical protein
MSKLPSSDKILEELIQAYGETSLSKMHKLSNSVSNKDEFPDQRNVYKPAGHSQLSLKLRRDH